MSDIEKHITGISAVLQLVCLSVFIYYSVKATRHKTELHPGMMWNPVQWFRYIFVWESYYTEEGVRLVRKSQMALNFLAAVLILQMIAIRYIK